MLILTGGPDPNTGETVASVGVATRMIQTFSFFTIQSNILVLIVAATLVINPGRDGRIWRILRLDALLGITITGLVFDLVLIHDEHPSGWQLVATIGFHNIAPWATLLGWLLFGPRPRIDRTTMAWAFLWPITWIALSARHRRRYECPPRRRELMNERQRMPHQARTSDPPPRRSPLRNSRWRIVRTTTFWIHSGVRPRRRPSGPER